jgi:hypothetical protein
MTGFNPLPPLQEERQVPVGLNSNIVHLSVNQERKRERKRERERE